jgi:hypothetical protein
VLVALGEGAGVALVELRLVTVAEVVGDTTGVAELTLVLVALGEGAGVALVELRLVTVAFGDGSAEGVAVGADVGAELLLATFVLVAFAPAATGELAALAELVVVFLVFGDGVAVGADVGAALELAPSVSVAVAPAVVVVGSVLADVLEGLALRVEPALESAIGEGAGVVLVADLLVASFSGEGLALGEGAAVAAELVPLADVSVVSASDFAGDLAGACC